MGKSDGARSGGVGILGLLTVAFVVLKLTGVIDWSWWWVLAPFWVPIVFWLLILVIVGIIQSAGSGRK